MGRYWKRESWTWENLTVFFKYYLLLEFVKVSFVHVGCLKAAAVNILTWLTKISSSEESLSSSFRTMSTLAGPAAPMMGVSHHHQQAVLAAAYFHHNQNNNSQNISSINSSSGNSSSSKSGGGSSSNSYNSLPERNSPVDVQPDRPIGYGAFGVVWWVG